MPDVRRGQRGGSLRVRRERLTQQSLEVDVTRLEVRRIGIGDVARDQLGAFAAQLQRIDGRTQRVVETDSHAHHQRPGNGPSGARKGNGCANDRHARGSISYNDLTIVRRCERLVPRRVVAVAAATGCRLRRGRDSVWRSAIT